MIVDFLINKLRLRPLKTIRDRNVTDSNWDEEEDKQIFEELKKHGKNGSNKGFTTKDNIA